MYECPNVVFITKDQPSKLSGITKEQLLDRQPIGLPPFVCWSCINTLGYMLPSRERGGSLLHVIQYSTHALGNWRGIERSTASIDRGPILCNSNGS